MMFLTVLAVTIVLLLLGGGWLIAVLAVLLLLLGIAAVGAYTVRWHELPLPWLLSRFMTYKTGVRVHVGTVTLRLLRSAGGQAGAQTHAMGTAENIVVDNPPGFSSRPLCIVGSVDVCFDPWSLLERSVLVQSLHIEAVQVRGDSSPALIPRPSLAVPHPLTPPSCRCTWSDAPDSTTQKRCDCS